MSESYSQRISERQWNQPDKGELESQREAGVLENMEFVQGALEDPSAYGDGQFDMVISFDAPVSYTYPNQERVIEELSRICKRKLLLSVSSRLGSLPYLADPERKRDFLDFCFEYAQNPYVLGMGKDNLFAMGVK